MTKIQEGIKKLRKEHHISQEKLAQILGYKKNAISQWETGKKEPNLDSILKIASYFNVSLDELVGNQTASKESTIEADLSPAKKEAIEKLLACNDRICDRVSAYIDVLNDRELAEDISKFKHNNNF